MTALLSRETNIRNRRKLAAIDIETPPIVAGSPVRELPIYCVTVVYGAGVDDYYSIWVDESTGCAPLSAKLEQLRDAGYLFVFHNGKFDVSVLRANDVNIPFNFPDDMLWHDTMAMSYCLYPDSMQNHSLSALAELVDEEKSDKPNFHIPDKDMMSKYNKQDALITWKLAHYFLDILEEDDQLLKYYLEIELPYVEILIQCESTGLRIDRAELQRNRALYAQEIEEYRMGINKIVGLKPGREIIYSKRVFSHYQMDGGKLKPIYTGVHNGQYDRCELIYFNPNSGDQVMQVLSDLYGYEPTKFTKTGKPKADRATLESLDPEKYPLVGDIVELGKKESMMSKFFDSISQKMHEDGRVHGEFRQFETRTRRLSSANPNLQNIPARGERGATIRKCFIAPDGYDLIVGDLDRIEVVVLAFYLEATLGESHLANLIRAGVDVHTENAKNWGIERTLVKNGLFCWLYGGGVNKLAETLRISRKEAKHIVDTMEAKLPELVEFRKLVIAMLVDGRGFMNDFFGGRIMIPEINSPLPGVYASAQRKAVNYLIQGTAGSVFKYLQLFAFEQLILNYQYEFHGNILFSTPVHDELLVFVRQDPEFAAVPQQLTNYFTTDSLLVSNYGRVPVSATFHKGSNWYDAKTA